MVRSLHWGREGCSIYPLKLEFLNIILQFDPETSVTALCVNYDSQHHAHFSLLQLLKQHIFVWSQFTERNKKLTKIMLAILLTPKLIGACICSTRETAFSLSPLNFPGQAMVTQSINSAFSHGSWGDYLQPQGSTEVWPDRELLNNWEAQNYLPSAWSSGSEQTEGKARVEGCHGTGVLTQYLRHTSHSPSLASALSWGTPCCDVETCFWWQTEKRQNFV